MNKQDNTPLELEQLLASVEHAGRNQRRQQQLADMIDGMAAREQRHPWHWYALRVAAAACVLFFILTAVRIWYLPTELPATPLVAEAEPVAVPAEVHQETLLAQPDSPTLAPKPVCKATPMPAVEEQEEVAVQEETVYVAEEIPETPIIAPLEEEAVTTPEPESDPTLLAETGVESNTMPAPQHEVEKPRRRSFFSRLFRPAEPDLMDGTTLAFNIL